MDLTIGKRGDFTAANHDHEQMNGERPAAGTQPLIDHLATRATSAEANLTCSRCCLWPGWDLGMRRNEEPSFQPVW